MDKFFKIYNSGQVVFVGTKWRWKSCARML